MSISTYTHDIDQPSEWVKRVDYEAEIARLTAQLRHARKFCRECNGTGKVTSWDVNSGPPLVQCRCRTSAQSTDGGTPR